MIEELRKTLLRSKITANMHKGIIAYVEDGLMPGGFLCAMIEGDLFEAVCRADAKNLAAIGEWADVVVNHIPLDCFGSEEKRLAWQAQGGLPDE